MKKILVLSAIALGVLFCLISNYSSSNTRLEENALLFANVEALTFENDNGLSVQKYWIFHCPSIDIYGDYSGRCSATCQLHQYGNSNVCHSHDYIKCCS